MGRLFWKFFFWLAQLVTSIGVGVAMWLLRPEHAPPGMGPPPGMHVDDTDREHRPPPHRKPSLLRTGWIGIEVTDQGSGVPEADLGAIFEPFFRSAGTDTFAGYGLGLAITRRIVEAHGGDVTARNRPNGGLCVSLRLPISST